MKVVLATPNFHQPRGNTVTVQRISKKLTRVGIETEIISITEDSKMTMLPTADVIHGFHAYHFYKFKEKLTTKIDSYVLTITGTDVNDDLFDDNKRMDVIRSVSGARAIHVFNEQAKKVLMTEIPNIEDKIYVIPQGVSELKDTGLVIEKEKDTVLFVLPAGIRKVKNIPFAIHNLKKLYQEFPSIRLLLVGPIIEADEGQLVKKLVNENLEWVQYIGEIQHEEMGAIYKQADVVLNTSYSEGQSTSIIEAMSYHLPVLVSANDGNLSLVTHEDTGFVFHNKIEFLVYAKQLVNNNEIREKLGESAHLYIDNYHSNPFEIETLLRMYHLSNRKQ